MASGLFYGHDHSPLDRPRCAGGCAAPIASSVADPQSLGIYEYTLRMTDGSNRVFQEALPASWRVGERLTLIDGQDPALD